MRHTVANAVSIRYLLPPTLMYMYVCVCVRARACVYGAPPALLPLRAHVFIIYKTDSEASQQQDTYVVV